MKDTFLAEAVQAICGQQRTITGKSPVFGGDINEAFRITLDGGTSFFMKSTLTKYDRDWNVAAENTAPFDGFDLEVNHIGDIDAWQGSM